MRSRGAVSIALAAVAVLGASACAARQPAFPPSSLVFRPGVRRVDEGTARHVVRVPPAVPVLPNLGVRPIERPEGVTVFEASDPGLAEALAALAASPTAPNHRALGSAYYRAGVLDLAFEHFKVATKLDARDAGAYEAMARIWRDWGFPHLGIADAHRAVFHAPGAPGPLNTLGTLLVAIGRKRDAMECFERALQLDPGAGYSWNNLCKLLELEDSTLAVKRGCEENEP